MHSLAFIWLAPQGAKSDDIPQSAALREAREFGADNWHVAIFFAGSAVFTVSQPPGPVPVVAA